jgi:hypothetical protein
MGHLDWAASRLAAAIERVSEALLVEEETQRIVPARELMRARPFRARGQPPRINRQSLRRARAV